MSAGAGQGKIGEVGKASMGGCVPPSAGAGEVFMLRRLVVGVATVALALGAVVAVPALGG